MKIVNPSFLYIFFCMLAAPFCSGFHPAWDDKLDFASLENRLQTEQVAHIERMGDYFKRIGKPFSADNAIKLITLESGLKAVFKAGGYRYAEVAAYKANQAVGQRLVPPTVMRTINGEEGSLQFFVATSIDLVRTTGKNNYFKKLHAKDLSDMKIFYFVFGQWDTHAGNQLIALQKGKPYLALIDNAAIHHRLHVRYGDYPFVSKGDKNNTIDTPCSPSFPFNEAKTVRPGSHKKLYGLFLPFISKQYIHSWIRPDAKITYVIWCGSLYIQHKSNKPVTTNRYYASTLRAYQKLDRDVLRDVWADGMKIHPEYYEELIDLILERRDQIIVAAHLTGTVVDDIH